VAAEAVVVYESNEVGGVPCWNVSLVVLAVWTVS
jgi:hypothetical protein